LVTDRADDILDLLREKSTEVARKSQCGLILQPGSDFEQNLIFTVNCTHGAAVVILPMRAPPQHCAHIADFYIQQIIAQSDVALEPVHTARDELLIRRGQTDVDRGRELLEEIDVDWSEKVTVMHPGSGSAGKCWHLDNFLAVANKLRGKGHHVVFLLGPAELERFDRSDRQKVETVANCLTELSLTEVLGLLSCAHCFIGNDTGITHLAAGIGTRTITLFGPTDPKVYGPIGPDVIILIGNETTFAESPSEQLQQQVLEAVAV